MEGGIFIGFFCSVFFRFLVVRWFFGFGLLRFLGEVGIIDLELYG